MSNLQNTLDWFEKGKPMKHMSPGDRMDLIVDAARRYANGDQMRWCTTHFVLVEEPEALVCHTGRQGAAYYPCHVVDRVLCVALDG